METERAPVETKTSDQRPFVRVPAETRVAIEMVALSNGWTYGQTVAEAIKRAYGLGPGAAGCRSLRIATDGRTKWAHERADSARGRPS